MGGKTGCDLVIFWHLTTLTTQVRVCAEKVSDGERGEIARNAAQRQVGRGKRSSNGFVLKKCARFCFFVFVFFLRDAEIFNLATLNA